MSPAPGSGLKDGTQPKWVQIATSTTMSGLTERKSLRA